MNDAVNRLLRERDEQDRGFGGGLVLSAGAHSLVVVAGLLVAFLAPKPPLLRVQMGRFVALPPGGGGEPGELQAAPPAKPAPEPPPAKPPEPKQILKPPKPEPRKGGLPDPSTSARKPKPSSTVVPPGGGQGAGAGSGATPGLSFGPPGPGVPGGTDMAGDWYLANVQRKVWIAWRQQPKADVRQPAVVIFTILADGSVTDVRLAQSSGVYLTDNAAQRAILSSTPFSPLPREYGTDRYTIQAIFKTTPE